MDKHSKHLLLISIMFISETGLEKAISAFRIWCQRNHFPGLQAYGFFKQEIYLGQFFLISNEQFEGWKLFQITANLEKQKQVFVRSFDCQAISDKILKVN